MAYTSKNPRFSSTVLTDLTTTTPSNPKSGSDMFINRNGILYRRATAGGETLAGRGRVNSVASANYVILDTDGYEVINVTTGASQRTITLPAVANNVNRYITIKKADNGAGTVLIDTPGSETIDGAAQNVLNSQYSHVTLFGDGTNWYVKDCWDYLASGSLGSGVTIGSGLTEVGNLSVSQGTWIVTGKLSCNAVQTATNYMTWCVSGTTASLTGTTVGIDQETMHCLVSTTAGSGTLSRKVTNTSATTTYLNAKSNQGSGLANGNFLGSLVAIRGV